MLQLQPAAFHRPRAGSTPSEWEDGVGFDVGDPATGRGARLVVADGATEAYDAIRWVEQLVTSFLGVDGDPAGPPALTEDGMDAWFGRMQARWFRDRPARFGSVFEEVKFTRSGSFATLLCAQVDGLAGPRPSWSAVALGDTVLFHVRGAEVLRQFPALAAEDFGLDPDGVFTAPEARGRMRDRLARAGGGLAPGDRLYVATDALAHWLVRAHRELDPTRLWDTLDRLDPAAFAALVEANRRAGALRDDDVTLLRLQLTDARLERLAVLR